MHNVDQSGGSGQAPTERAVPIPGLPMSPVSGDRIELFVQTTAKLQKSGWQETTTELVRRRSTTIAADWMKVKAASATPHGKESLHTLQAGFPQLHLAVPTGLKWKTLRGPGGCVWGGNFPPPPVFWLLLSL